MGHTDRFEVIRGRRPPSVQWPKGKGKGKLDDGVQLQSGAGGGRPVGRWKRGGVGVPQSSQFGEAARCVGSQDSLAKREVEAALTRAKEQETAQVRFDPDAKVAVVRDRAARLQTTIAALGDCRMTFIP